MNKSTNEKRKRELEARFGSILEADRRKSGSDGEPDSQLHRPRRLPDLDGIKMGDTADTELEL